MLKLNPGVARSLAADMTAVVVLAPPQLASAQTPGTLAQPASPNDCIQDANVSSGRCSSSTAAPGLSGATHVAVSPDGKNVYVLGSADEAIAELTRNPNGSLTELGCIADTHASQGTSCTSNETAAGLFNTQAIVVSREGKNVSSRGDRKDRGWLTRR